MTPRQTQVAALIADGLPNKLIARRLDLSVGTVKTHAHNAMHALGVRTRAEVISIIAHERATAPRLPADGKSLHVERFATGACGITLKGQALHLRPDEALDLARRLARLYPEAAW